MASILESVFDKRISPEELVLWLSNKHKKVVAVGSTSFYVFSRCIYQVLNFLYDKFFPP